MPSRTYTTTIHRDGSTCFVPVPFDPKEAFGKARAPVKVTLNGYTYRSTIALMGGPPFIPLRKSHREAAGLDGGESLEVVVELDVEPRTVDPPADLVKALKAVPGAWQRWTALSYTHQREHVEAIEDARAAATRARRISRAVETCAGTDTQCSAAARSATIAPGASVPKETALYRECVRLLQPKEAR